ncbi:MAG: IS66 family transposase [Moraxellaceae bacterium]|nr:IS66 family transposase [Moraxellaceae bacterium]
MDSQDPIVVFDYQGNREGRHVRAFLGDWQGHLVVDDYVGYKALFEATNTEGKRLRTEVGCWAHIRRKFFEVHVKTKHPIAAEALRRIQCLYAIEREAQEQNLSTVQRQALRVEKSVPILLAFEVWLKEQTHCVAPSSGLAQALAHALKRWPSLVVYAQTGDVPIDNNPVENSIRPIAVGKKNWLFAGSERAGQRAAAIQSLLATAKLNGLEPLAWLTDTLEKLPTWPKSRLDELLPLRSMAKKTYEKIARPIILNGIDDIASRGDLLNRSFQVNLPALNDDKRGDEQELATQYNQAKPVILAAFLDMLSVGLRDYDQIEKIKTSGRFVSLPRFVTAAERGLGLPELFAKTYDKNTKQGVELALETSPLAQALITL